MRNYQKSILQLIRGMFRAKHFNWRVFLFAIVLSCAHFNYGYSIAYSGNAQLVYTELNFVDDSNSFMYSAVLNIGALAGCFLSGFVTMDFFGRKYTVLASSAFYSVGWLLTLMVGLRLFDDKNYALLIVSRLVIGVGLGMASTCVQVYLTECLSIRLRNYYSIYPTIAISVGMFVNFLVGYFMLKIDYDRVNLGNEQQQHQKSFGLSLVVMPVVGLCFSLFQCVSSFFMPESITYYSIKMRSKNGTNNYTEENAKKLVELIKRLYINFDGEKLQNCLKSKKQSEAENGNHEHEHHESNEHHDGVNNLDTQNSTSALNVNENYIFNVTENKDMPPIDIAGLNENTPTILEKIKKLKNRQTLLPMGIGIMLMLMQQFFGVFAILYNSTVIFASAGLGRGSNKAEAALGSIAIGGVSLVCIFVGMVVLNYMKRKPPLIMGAGLKAVPLFVLGACFQYNLTKTQSWLGVLCVVLFFVIYNITWASLPWIFMSEAIHGISKSYAVGLVSLSNWLFGFVAVACFPYMIGSFQYHGSMYFFGAVCLLSAGLCYLLVPETKEKTVQEMERVFKSKLVYY